MTDFRQAIFGVLLLVLSAGCAMPPRPLGPEAAALREQKIRALLSQGVQGLRARSDAGADVAEAAFEIALALDPTDARVLDALGCLAFYRRNYELAKQYFQRAIEKNRNYDRPVAHLAAVAELKGDTVAALELYHLARRINPLNYRNRNNFAVFLASELGSAEHDRAYQELLQAAVLSGEEEGKVNRNLRFILTPTAAAPDE